MGFWIGVVIGVVLGFGAGVLLFLPIAWRQVALEDKLDDRKRELDKTVATIERLKHNLDVLAGRRERAIFQDITGANNGRRSLIVDSKTPK